MSFKSSIQSIFMIFLMSLTNSDQSEAPEASANGEALSPLPLLAAADS